MELRDDREDKTFAPVPIEGVNAGIAASGDISSSTISTPTRTDGGSSMGMALSPISATLEPARGDFSIGSLIGVVNDATVDARDKVNDVREQSDSISIGDMFDMQMLMNRLSQLSEMSTSVVSASNTATLSMARNVKG